MDKITVRKLEAVGGSAVIDTVTNSPVNGWTEWRVTFNTARTGYKVIKSFYRSSHFCIYFYFLLRSILIWKEYLDQFYHNLTLQLMKSRSIRMIVVCHDGHKENIALTKTDLARVTTTMSTTTIKTTLTTLKSTAKTSTTSLTILSTAPTTSNTQLMTGSELRKHCSVIFF